MNEKVQSLYSQSVNYLKQIVNQAQPELAKQSCLWEIEYYLLFILRV